MLGRIGRRWRETTPADGRTPAVILTVTANFALDLTYHLDHYERGKTARVATVARQAGGKGVNAARVLHTLGRDVAVTGFVGGFTGREARAELIRAGMRDALVEITGESRIATMVVERDGAATGFSEPGPRITAGDWAALRDRFEALLGDADAVIVAGSVPPGVPPDGYAQLVAAARAADVPVLLDADGDALALGVQARPDIVKINEAEVRGLHDHGHLLEAARALQQRGAGAVVITQGADGLTALTADGDVFHAAPPEPLRGNPTGAGDAASAALVTGLLDGRPWPERLTDATALSAAAVCAPLAGQFDAAAYTRLRASIAPQSEDTAAP
jgi:tagatose 6-phosphate kinase